MQGFGLHLPNAFAGDSKDSPDLLKRLLVPIHHPESPPKNLPLSGRERLQDRLDSFPSVAGNRHVGRRGRRMIREGVPERVITILSDWRLERDGVVRDLSGLEDLCDRQVQCPAQLGGGGLATPFLDQRLGGPGEALSS